MKRDKKKKDEKKAVLQVIVVVCKEGHRVELPPERAHISSSGGCYGHFGGDGRCYCPSPDIDLDFTCSECFPDPKKLSFSETIHLREGY